MQTHFLSVSGVTISHRSTRPIDVSSSQLLLWLFGGALMGGKSLPPQPLLLFLFLLLLLCGSILQAGIFDVALHGSALRTYRPISRNAARPQLCVAISL